MFRRKRKQSDFSAEIDAHLSIEADRLREQGLGAEEARNAARRAFGNVMQAEERFYESGCWMGWDHLMLDLWFGLRTLRKNPGFTAVAVLTLALGIGANTAIFTLVNALLLRTLPVEKPNQLVLLGHGLDRGVVGQAQRGSWELFSYAFYEDLRDHNRVFQNVCAIQSFEDSLNLRIGNTTTTAPGRLVSGNYFSVLGVRPLLGRMLTPEDDTTGAAPAAVITYRFWRKQFSRDSAVLGKTVSVNGTVFTIVGVTRRRSLAKPFKATRRTCGCPSPPNHRCRSRTRS